MCFIIDHLKINQKIVRKPYPLTITVEIIQHLEGFQYATTLDFNIGYYTIDISPKGCDLTSIVTGFGKYRYHRFSMGLCVLSDKFQAKVNEILVDIKGIKMNINNVLVLYKRSFSQHIDQVSVIFFMLRITVLIVNAPKCSLGLHDITYLGYNITRDGTKPDTKIFKGSLILGELLQ